MGRFIDKAIDAVFARPLELLTAFEAAVFGIWLLLPFNTFASSRSFEVMARWLPEPFWGTLMLAVGLAQLLTLSGGRSGYVRLTATLAAVAWLFVTASFWEANPATTGVGTYALFVLMNAVIILRYAGGTSATDER